MTDADLRSLVRHAVERHLAPAAGAPDPDAPLGPSGALAWRPAASHFALPAGHGAHVSHAIYVTLVNGTEACLIEPAVSCNHCGYCKSHGH